MGLIECHVPSSEKPLQVKRYQEETVIYKSEGGRETTKIVEQRPPQTSFIVKQFNW